MVNGWVDGLMTLGEALGIYLVTCLVLLFVEVGIKSLNKD